jgi:hypothetical protein
MGGEGEGDVFPDGGNPPSGESAGGDGGWERACPHAHRRGQSGGARGKPIGWHSRGYLPHLESDEKIQSESGEGGIGGAR